MARDPAKIRANANRYYHRHQALNRLRIKHRRRKDPAWAVLQDTRTDDGKKKRANDLDLEFVRTALANACSYCGEAILRRTLDRIDNAYGHTRENVRVACERCNYVRRDMPIEAWLIVAEGMRVARERGLFSMWTGAIHRRDPLEPLPLPALKELPPHGTLARYKTCREAEGRRCVECRRAMADWKQKRRSHGS